MKLIALFVLAIVSLFPNNSKQNLQEYVFKSGMIKYKLEGRISGTEQIYFDDYGKLFYDLKTINRNKTEYSDITLNILCYDTIITIKEIDHTAIKSTVSDLNLKNKHNLINPELLIEMGYTKTSDEKVSGIVCEKYSGENGNMWVWNNIILKSEIEIMGIIIYSEAIEIITGIDIPKTKFQIPNNYKINYQ